MTGGWGPDVLGAGFEARTLPLRATATDRPRATLVRHPGGGDPTRRAVLYVHGYNDYFFQRDLAAWWAGRGTDFYALDLRRHGRSLEREGVANYTGDLAEYDEELDAAAAEIAAAGHERLVLCGHSTGGLTVPLWLERRPHLPVDGVVLNSPFLEFRQPAAVRAVVGPVASVVARRRPLQVLPAGVDSAYGDSLHVSRDGEWDYDLAWKPSPGFPARLGWVAAVVAAHRRVHAGLHLRPPVLVMASTRSVARSDGPAAARSGDAVLDADSIARWAPALGRHVTVVRIADGMHDLVLSRAAARAEAYATMGSWADAWLP